MKMGERIRILRKEHNMTQLQLAEKMNVTDKAVSKWERGESTPDTDTLIELAKLYNASLDELVGHEKTNKENEEEPDSTGYENTVRHIGIFDATARTDLCSANSKFFERYCMCVGF